jgi:hypothetical protein
MFRNPRLVLGVKAVSILPNFLLRDPLRNTCLRVVFVVMLKAEVDQVFYVIVVGDSVEMGYLAFLD